MGPAGAQATCWVPLALAGLKYSVQALEVENGKMLARPMQVQPKLQAWEWSGDHMRWGSDRFGIGDSSMNRCKGLPGCPRLLLLLLRDTREL